MTTPSDRLAEPDAEWLIAQIEAYRNVLPHYRKHADLLRRALQQAAAKLCPGAIIQARPKSVASFAEKALRKRAKYADPLTRFTDLCGARVIARTRVEVAAICAWIEAHFEISWQDSGDASARLGPASFGYGSVHYIVSCTAGADLGVEIPAELVGLRAEVQVRTMLQHAWAVLAHDLSYKSALELPSSWQRELAVVAAELENADNALARIEKGLRRYASSYPSYLTATEIFHEIALLETVLRYDPGNADLAYRVATLASSVGDWAKAIAVLTPLVRRDQPPGRPGILTQLGFALCKQHEHAPDGDAFRRGQEYLTRAGQPPILDSNAISALADTWRTREPARARELYRQAFELDPANYHALTRYLEREMGQMNSTSILPLVRPTMAAALERCRAEAAAGINSPWAHFGMAKLQLLMSDPDESLRTYCLAIRASTAAFMIEDEIFALDQLGGAKAELAGFDHVRQLLVVAAAAKFPAPDSRGRLDRCESPPGAIVAGPVVIVAGGTDSSAEDWLSQYQGLLVQAFGSYYGTIICGGTTSGISGLVGEVGQRYPDSIRTVGYLPGGLSGDADEDARYDEIRRTNGVVFSAVEPLRYWADLIASGIAPADVKLLGINGGLVAAAEFRIALALGASVGVVPESGREADRLLAEEAWLRADNLIPVPDDPQTVAAFIDTGALQPATDLREPIGRAIHASHRREQVAALPGWDNLDRELRESSMLQADHIWVKLRRIGCETYRVTDRPVALMTFTGNEVEALAEMEHGRWNAERLATGWRWAQHGDTEHKLSPYLVPWAELPDQVREWDRNNVRKIPEFLAAVQLEIRRAGP